MQKKGDDMEPQEDVIVDIPENRRRYFGGPGKMLLPCPATVEALIKKIPEHQLITTKLLEEALTEQFKVQGTCPVTTKKALQTIAHNANTDVAYWRVVNKSGGLIATFPGGVEAQAALLREEGFVIDTTGKAPKVDNFKASLARRA